MATEAAAATRRPRPWLLVALGLAIVLFLAVKFWPSAPAPPPAQPQRAQSRPGATAGSNGMVDPAELTVRLESLKEARPDPGGVDRNPFRFYQPPPPPMPVAPPTPVKPVDEPPPGPPPPPPPPPIPIKFIGIVEGRGVGKVAAFSDCKRTFYGREGDIVDGRYKLLKIGVESVTMVYPDGRGQQMIRLSGQECIGK